MEGALVGLGIAIDHMPTIYVKLVQFISLMCAMLKQLLRKETNKMESLRYFRLT